MLLIKLNQNNLNENPCMIKIVITEKCLESKCLVKLTTKEEVLKCQR